MKNLVFFSFILLSFPVTYGFSQTKFPRKKLNQTIEKDIKHKKQLVYLFAANGGMIGYFSDGSVVGCPKCDFCRTNILAMFEKKSFDKWDLTKPSDFTSYKEDKSWVLVNYKWNEKVPKF